MRHWEPVNYDRRRMERDIADGYASNDRGGSSSVPCCHGRCLDAKRIGATGGDSADPPLAAATPARAALAVPEWVIETGPYGKRHKE